MLVLSALGTPTRTYVVGATRRPPATVTVLVNAVPPTVVVKEVARVGGGVGELTKTYVVLPPTRPPIRPTEVMVLVKATDPLVCVTVARTAQNGITRFRHAVRSVLTKLDRTLERKQPAAVVRAKSPRAD
jgi:hypothetical protein